MSLTWTRTLTVKLLAESLIFEGAPLDVKSGNAAPERLPQYHPISSKVKYLRIKMDTLNNYVNVQLLAEY